MRSYRVLLTVLIALPCVFACTAGDSGPPSADPTVEPIPTPTATPVHTPQPVPPPTSTSTPEPVSSMPIAACTAPGVSCEPRDLSGGSDSISARAAAAASGYGSREVPTLEERLEEGYRWTGSHVDIVLRGTTNPATLTCEWHGYAQANDEREAWLRVSMGLPEPTPIPSLSEIESVYLPRLDFMPPDDFAKRKAWVYGGLVEDNLYLYCFADYRVHEYILGDGPGLVTVAYPLAHSWTYSLFQQMDQWSSTGRGPYT